MVEQLDIEKDGVLNAYLLRNELIGYDEVPAYTILTGGVSNRSVMVHRTNADSFVVKQALHRLRVETEWLCDPSRIEREALALNHLQTILPSGSTPGLRFFDEENSILIMDAVPDPHDNWKTILLSGQVQRDHISQFAHLLAALHKNSHAMRDTIESVFESKRFFIDLRIKPYHEYTMQFHEQTIDFFSQLIEETLETNLCLVHGDYSPKNILVHQGKLILLDHEVIHWGDPAFDVGFSMTHLLSKAHHRKEKRDEFTHAAHQFWSEYSKAVGDALLTDSVSNRCVRQTLACLLARIDGRSPLEYLDGWQRKKQRVICLDLIQDIPKAMNSLIDTFTSSL